MKVKIHISAVYVTYAYTSDMDIDTITQTCTVQDILSSHTTTRNINAIEIERVTAKNYRKRATKYTLHTYAPMLDILEKVRSVFSVHKSMDKEKNNEFQIEQNVWTKHAFIVIGLPLAILQLMHACLNVIWIVQNH